MTATLRQTPLMSRPQFLAAVRTSKLVEPAQLNRAVGRLSSRATTGAEVAQEFVAANVLTDYQATRLLAGKTDGMVIGQYHIEDRVARSTVGQVYRARHRTMNRLVAIKVLAPEFTKDPVQRAAFQAEARLAARLAHPNVVTVLDVNQIDGRLYVVLEFVDGVSLDRLVREQGPLPVARACEYARQALLGLAHAHHKGMPHGSVTPANLLVGRPGGQGRTDRPAVKVTNFGLGRFIEPQAVGADECDPSDYRAPEMLSPRTKVPPTADLYAIGCTLFYLLTGRTPFAGGTSQEKHLRHLAAPPPDVEQFRRDVPAPVAGLVRALLAKDPQYRPSDADQVAAVLEPFVGEHHPGHVEFSFPAPAQASGAHPDLSGLHNQPSGTHARRDVDLTDTSPWAGIDSPTLDEEAGHTPVSTTVGPKRTDRPGLAMLGYAAAVVAVLAATGLGAGFVIAVLSGR